MKRFRIVGIVLMLLTLTACGVGRQAAEAAPAAADARGIPGMLAEPLAEALSGDPYWIPASQRMTPSGKQADLAAFVYESHGKDDTGLTFDYEILSDANDELVTATLSVSATRMSDTKLVPDRPPPGRAGLPAALRHRRRRRAPDLDAGESGQLLRGGGHHDRR